jgi:hypothetical protein
LSHPRQLRSCRFLSIPARIFTRYAIAHEHRLRLTSLPLQPITNFGSHPLNNPAPSHHHVPSLSRRSTANLTQPITAIYRPAINPTPPSTATGMGFQAHEHGFIWWTAPHTQGLRISGAVASVSFTRGSRRRDLGVPHTRFSINDPIRPSIQLRNSG